MSVKQARDLLWKIVDFMSNEELELFIVQCKRIASVIMDFAEIETTNK